MMFCSRLLTLLALVLLSSCGTGFHRQWEQAQVPATSIEGRWQGTWTSSFNGHSGKLLCLVGPEKPGHTREFRYFATWAKIFRGSFNAVHDVTEKGGATTFKARHDIGKRGTFNAEGTVTPTEFRATYKAAGDHGVFVLKRPAY